MNEEKIELLWIILVVLIAHEIVSEKKKIRVCTKSESTTENVYLVLKYKKKVCHIAQCKKEQNK